MSASDRYLSEEKIEQSLKCSDSAIFCAKKITNNYYRAKIYEEYGIRQRHIGDKRKGHACLYEAIAIFKSLTGCEAEIATCYDNIAKDYLFFSDYEALEIVLNEIKQLVDIHPCDTIFCDYYTNKASYFYLDYTMNYTEHSSDSALYYYLKAAEIAERTAMPESYCKAFNYYKIALCYLLFYEDFSKVDYYVDCMEKNKNVNYMDIEITIAISYLKMLNYCNHDNQNEAAIKEISHTLLLLEHVNRRSVNNFRNNFFYYLALVYYQTGDYKQSIEYFLKYDECFTQTILQDRRDALANLKFQSDRKEREQQINLLSQHNKFYKIIIISLSLFLIAFIAFLILFIRYSRLRRVILEQNAYENLIVSKMQEDELTKRNSEITILQAQYDRILMLSKRNESTAVKYKTRLEELQNKLKQSHCQMLVEQMKDLISHAIMSGKTKNTYIEQLDQFKIQEFEKQLALVKENLTNIDIKYIICFLIEMNIKDMGLLFNVEVSSIYNVRSRLRRKTKEVFPIL